MLHLLIRWCGPPQPCFDWAGGEVAPVSNRVPLVAAAALVRLLGICLDLPYGRCQGAVNTVCECDTPGAVMLLHMNSALLGFM